MGELPLVLRSVLLKFHAETPVFIRNHLQPLSFSLFTLHDIGQRESRLLRERHYLWTRRFLSEEIIEVIDQCVDLFIGKPVTATSVFQVLQRVRAAVETMQSVFREDRLRLWENSQNHAHRHRFMDAGRSHFFRLGISLFDRIRHIMDCTVIRTETPPIILLFVPKILRIFTLLSLPILTLFLGWQLGASYEQKQLSDEMRALEAIYGGETGSGQVVQGDPEQEVDIAVLWGVWRLLQKHYIAPDELQTTPLVFGAVEGMVRSVGDPYTVFMTPSQNTDFRKALEGKLQGIGAELTFKDGLIVVVNPLKGSPAAAAGILPEDIIVEVDGVDIAGENLNQVVQRIRGTKGTTVQLKIIREGNTDPLMFSIVRDDINIPSIESEIKKTASGSVGYVALNQFGDTSIDELKEALKTFDKEPTEGIILDLRFNGGGYLEGAVELASIFLRKGEVVSVERRGTDLEHHYVYGRPSHADIPLVVLINQGSASASEIVAGALQDHGRAKIIGMKSFGKGTVQEVIDLPGGSSLRVTTARWLTPHGKNLGKEGVHPDIVVDRTVKDYETKNDPQLQAALEWLLDQQDVTAKQ